MLQKYLDNETMNNISVEEAFTNGSKHTQQKPDNQTKPKGQGHLVPRTNINEKPKFWSRKQEHFLFLTKTSYRIRPF